MSLLVLKAELKASNSVDRPSQVVLEILRLFWSIKRLFGEGGERRFGHFFILFWGHFGNLGHFRGFRVDLVVLEIFRLFWSIKRFRGVFFFRYIYFGGILAILVILEVFGLF